MLGSPVPTIDEAENDEEEQDDDDDDDDDADEYEDYCNESLCECPSLAFSLPVYYTKAGGMEPGTAK